MFTNQIEDVEAHDNRNVIDVAADRVSLRVSSMSYDCKHPEQIQKDQMPQIAEVVDARNHVVLIVEKPQLVLSPKLRAFAQIPVIQIEPFSRRRLGPLVPKHDRALRLFWVDRKDHAVFPAAARSLKWTRFPFPFSIMFPVTVIRRCPFQGLGRIVDPVAVDVDGRCCL